MGEQRRHGVREKRKRRERTQIVFQYNLKESTISTITWNGIISSTILVTNLANATIIAIAIAIKSLIIILATILRILQPERK